MRASFRVLFSLLMVALLHSTAVNGDVGKLRFNKTNKSRLYKDHGACRLDQIIENCLQKSIACVHNYDIVLLIATTVWSSDEKERKVVHAS